ncbi:MAG: glycosyltransferase family 4 protein [Terriglobales bacterium]
MRIAVLTFGRFHVCDLARELDSLGHDVAFYSLVPPWRTQKVGLPNRCNRWLAPYVAPLYAAARAAKGTVFEARAHELLIDALDRIASTLISRCDVFIGMSGMCLHTIQAVRRKYQTRIFVERGSRHIVSQKEILENIPGRQGSAPAISEWSVRREIAEYELADTIVVPAKHVVQSFTERGVPESRIFRNPYGVDLNMFPATQAPSLEVRPQIIMAGTWSLQKGCDVLVDAWRRLRDVGLIHVGSVGDAPLPREPDFKHYSPVEQHHLTGFYARSHVFGLASRQDGLALVQAQALASGLPVVCTDRTGGEDLREYLENPDSVSVVPSDDPRALASALQIALDKARSVKGLRDLLGPGRAALSWRAYGMRYAIALGERA